jgi:hypothetical protein
MSKKTTVDTSDGTISGSGTDTQPVTDKKSVKSNSLCSGDTRITSNSFSSGDTR